ncbi:5034_t:CDS:2, partial [Entrophospora sp. SA101]
SNNNVHIPMNKEIEDTINYGEIKNTTCNTRFWLKLQEELIQFFQVLNKKDKSPYAPTSKKIALLLYIDTPLSTTYKTYFWLCFLCGFCGGDAQRLKLANVELAAINGLTITIPCGKNNAGY